MSDLKAHVENMIKKAAEADKSDDAMRFSQAACNAANAMCALSNATPSFTPTQPAPIEPFKKS